MLYWNSVWQSISPWVMNHGLKIAGLLVFALVVKLIAKKVITKAIERIIVARDGMTHDDEVKREQTLIRIVYGTVRIVVWIVVFLMILAELGINIGPLIAGAGIIGLAI